MTPVGDDYAQIGDVPLSTPAWITKDLSSLYGDNDWSLDGTDLAYHHGEHPSPPWLEPRGVSIPMVVVGHRDPDGVALTDRRLGRADNLDALKAALRNPTSGDGTLDLRHVLTGRTTRSTRCQVLRTRHGRLSNDLMNVLVDLWLPDGILANTTSETADGTGSAAFDVVVPNPGTADQYDATISLSGTATAVKILSGQHALQYVGDLSEGAVTLKTGPMTADRVSEDVHGLVSSSYARWLPIPAGGDTWTVSPVGGSVTVAVSHKAPWL